MERLWDTKSLLALPLRGVMGTFVESCRPGRLKRGSSFWEPKDYKTVPRRGVLSSNSINSNKLCFIKYMEGQELALGCESN